MSALDSTRSRPSETIGGYLSALAIFVSLIGIAWHPLRLIAPSIVIALVAAAMGGRHQRLAFAAVLVTASAFFVGMLIAVITSRALW
jgi:hypothetical protein